MKRYVLFIALLAAGSLVSSCMEIIKGSGDLVEETRTENVAYTGIIVESGIIVEFSASLADDEVVVSGDSNILPYLETYVRSGSLVIKYKNRTNIKERSNTVVTLPEIATLRYIRASGASSVTGDHFTESGTIDIKCSGASVVTMRGNCQNLNIESSGGSKIKITGNSDNADIEGSGSSVIEVVGSTNDVDIELSGSSKLINYSLTAVDVDCDLSGSSTVEIVCSGTLEVSASGSSKVYYKGSGTVTKQNLSGSAGIIKK